MLASIPDIVFQDYLLLGIAALLAGLVDAVVGGGGLIQLPALFGVFPQAHPASLLGTNKLASIWGTAIAARSYAKRITLQWSTVLPATGAALVFAFLGAWTVTRLPPDVLRKLLPVILLLLAIYSIRAKEMGLHHAPRLSGAKERWCAIAVGSGIGFYDGFFGPGTGTFLVFLFVRFFGFDFVRASASAKLVNVACNLSALLLFAGSGHVIWLLGILMACCNMVGSAIGSRLALTHGSGFVRSVFLWVLAALILKTSYNAYLA